MLSLEDTIRAVEAIEKTIDKAAYGWANAVAIKEIDAQVFTLKAARGDAYISEKVCIVAEYARDLYSPRKADKWGGSEQVQRTILTACQSLKDRAGIIERQTKEADLV
ncbi:MAG: hypothetical protein JWM43_399 [Acidobacteriaceae bacterium]|nr:hypothetical protein [Acidobacteriaceae bacterium]